MITGIGKPGVLGETSSSTNPSTTNITWTALRVNPVFGHAIPTSKWLSFGITVYVTAADRRTE
jgi:hypothetical protein